MISNLKDSIKGIKLIALVITIVVLIILASISISILINNGIIDKAKTAVQKYKNAQEDEETKIANLNNKGDEYIGNSKE